MPLICITGHQGTGKSTLLHKLNELGYIAYGLDEERLAGYFNLEQNIYTTNIPTGSERNLSWRETNIWKVDIEKVRNFNLPTDKPVFLLGFASNIEELWDICDAIVILNLDKSLTIERLTNRTNNSFGTHPGEMELALKNSKVIAKKANTYTKHPIKYIDASLDVTTIAKRSITAAS